MGNKIARTAGGKRRDRQGGSGRAESRQRTISALELGSTRTNMVMVGAEESGPARVLGFGHCEADGIQHGVVSNVEATSRTIRKSRDLVEGMASRRVESVWLGIGGRHTTVTPSRGAIAVKPRSGRGSGEITEFHVAKVMDIARTMAVPSGQRCLQVVPVAFAVDGESGIANPLGLTGTRLEVEAMLISEPLANVQNMEKAVEWAGLALAGFLYRPLATGYAVLTEDERALGACMIDIGGDTTDMVLLRDGGVQRVATLGLGGKHVTNDICHSLQVPFKEAERLKVAHGHCYSSLERDESVEVGGLPGRAARLVPRSVLGKISQPRMEEIFEQAFHLLEGAEPSALPGGLVLGGGGSQLAGLVQLAEQLFGLPARRAHCGGLPGIGQLAADPAYASALGMAVYALANRTDELGKAQGGGAGARLLALFRSWLEAILKMRDLFGAQGIGKEV